MHSSWFSAILEIFHKEMISYNYSVSGLENSIFHFQLPSLSNS